MEIKLNVKTVVLVRRDEGIDHIVLTIEANTPFPMRGYEPYFEIQCDRGHGPVWLRDNLGIDLWNDCKKENIGYGKDSFLYTKHL
jgi:hypothetical protein